MGKIIAGAVIVIAVIAFFVLRGDHASAPTNTKEMKTKTETTVMKDDDVKEFSMTSYYDADGKWFSLKEIKVKQGDKVRIKVTNTKGTHDFAVDEYGIKEMTPLDKETVIEFTADKKGEFAYYCSVPGHRAGGQEGKLIVE